MLGVVLGGGRMLSDDTIDFAAGIRVLRNVGDRVDRGEPLATIELGEKEIDDATLIEQYRAAVKIGASAPEKMPLVGELLTASLD
jgi:pyrimidine-nucleoside phosphorylase